MTKCIFLELIYEEKRIWKDWDKLANKLKSRGDQNLFRKCLCYKIKEQKDHHGIRNKEKENDTVFIYL